MRDGADAAAESCAMCGGELEFAFSTSDRNRAVTTRRFAYRRCRRCGTLGLADIPRDLGSYYPPDYYGSDEAAPLDSPLEHAKLASVREHRPHGRLVEIGPGAGAFSVTARDAGYSVAVVEMDERACDRLRRAGIEAICSSAPQDALPQLPPSDVVVLWHVLEHLRDPALVVRRIAENLTDGGVVAIAVPNPASLQFRLLRGRWAHVDAPRHLFLIPLEALAACAAAHGLTLHSAVTDDLAGLHWNRFGWECALRRFPAVHPSTRSTRLLAAAIARVLSPWERRELAGSTYTALFVKRQ